jgi:DNA topoisomerase-3
MSKSLIIAEKPSVAADIARALGGFTRRGEYYESERYLLSSAVGHLLEIGMPEEEEVKRGKWTFAHLPAIPSKFALRPIEKNEDRLKTLLRLIKSKDVSELINACDAGREGELIFRYIVQYSKTNKAIRRLWLQSMTPAAIREAFVTLRTDAQMRPLADAAVCRSESDWLVGINGTRAMTAFNSKSGGFQLTTVGRVQTPTLAILTEREERIRAFRPRSYWEVIATFRASGGEYGGRWFDEGFRKDDDEHARAERLWDEEKANALRRKCEGRPGTVSEESRPSSQIAPLLYDLTSLQREANGRFGFSARTTLALAQSLYEKHKAITYPRTDSRALPEYYLATVQATMESLADVPSSPYAPFAAQVLKQHWVRPNRRIFDNAKVSDHFAIIPTLAAPKHLNEVEAKLYDFIVRRFLAAFHPPAEFTLTTRITRVEGEPFKSEGRVLVTPGWLAVYGKEAQPEPESAKSGDKGMLAPVAPGENVATEKVEVVAQTTRPPARFSEATLLSAMEGAGKTIDDEELREAMRDKGLGTPATRAQIIEGLIAEKYILREGKELVPTAKAFQLITLLHGLGVPELYSPELTADWEFKLAQMEHGRLARADFMHIVTQAKRHESDDIDADFGVLAARCPKCGGEVHERYKKFQCQRCDFGFWKIVAGRQLEVSEADTLLREGRVGPLEGFRSKAGRPFAAALKLLPSHEVAFDFGETASDEDVEPPDFSGQEPLGACPKCGARVFELPQAYVCEKAVGAGKTCDFRSGRVILQRPIEREQMAKLLASGKTDLLQFVSARTRRPFSAFLVRQDDGKIGFEFEPRDASRSRGRAPRAAAPLRVLGKHPGDGEPVELHAGRYGPYVKHGAINATLPDRDRIASVTLEEALTLLDAKLARTGGTPAETAARTGKITSPARETPRRKPAAAPAPAPAVRGRTTATRRSGAKRR